MLEVTSALSILDFRVARSEALRRAWRTSLKSRPRNASERATQTRSTGDRPRKNSSAKNNPEHKHESTNMKAQEVFPPLKVILPEELHNFYAERGYLATKPHEDRGFARLNVRSLGHIRFDMQISTQYFRPVTNDEQRGAVLVKDLSRTGIAILYHRQTFPGERFDIVFHERAIKAMAVRCRRIGELCFETGATILSVTSEPEFED